MATDPQRRPPTIDAAAAARWRRLAPADGSPWLHEEIGRRMEDRLQWIKARPRHWADWAPLRGGLEAHELLAREFRAARAALVEANVARAEREARERDGEGGAKRRRTEAH